MTEKEIVLKSLEEDLWEQDITTQTLQRVQNIDKEVFFKVFSKERGVFSGARWLNAFSELGLIKIDSMLNEGDRFGQGDTVLLAQSSLMNALKIERTLLNGLQNFCGIATQTTKITDIIAEKAQERGLLGDLIPKLFHTRKTLPLLREFQVDAILAGGAFLHRKNLSTRLMFKDNHKEIIQKMGYRYGEFVAKFLKDSEQQEALFEVDTVHELKELMKSTQIKNVLLDNFSIKELKTALNLIKDDIVIEVSGGIKESNVEDYVLKGVHRISVGWITHSVEALDMSAEWD